MKIMWIPLERASIKITNSVCNEIMKCSISLSHRYICIYICTLSLTKSMYLSIYLSLSRNLSLIDGVIEAELDFARAG